MYELNRQRLLEEIIKHGYISRADLAKITGLNKATVSSHVSKFIDEGLIVETAYDTSTGGRRPILIALNEDAGVSLGIDIDRDSITCILLSLSGKVLNVEEGNYEENNYQDLLNKLETIIDHYINKRTHGYRYGLIGIGISIHGLVRNNHYISFVNQQQSKAYPFYEDLKYRYPDVPITVENNANLGAIAEQSINPELKEDYVLYLTVRSGIGLGIIQNHQLYLGKDGIAGEFGHTIVERGGRACRCGNQGCFEQYASLPSLIKSIMKVKGNPFHRDRLIDALDASDEEVIREVKCFAEYLSLGVNNLIQLFNPNRIVIEEPLDHPLFKRILEDALGQISTRGTTLSFSQVKGNASALGAAIIQLCDFLQVEHYSLPQS